jgi:hypothetical protein
MRLSCGEAHTRLYLVLRGRKSGYAPVEMANLLQETADRQVLLPIAQQICHLDRSEA